MGFIGSSCSFTRFRILDAVSDALLLEVQDRLRKYAFRDIDNIPEMQSVGWVSFDDMLDTEWNEAPARRGEYLLFSLRLDTRRIPSGVIKKYYALALRAEKEHLKTLNKNFISRERKKEIKEQVLLRLRERFLPVPGEFNVIWSVQKNEVWFASTQGKMIDLFMEEFLKTFELHLEQLTPYGMALALLAESQQAGLDLLEATQFALIDSAWR